MRKNFIATLLFLLIAPVLIFGQSENGKSDRKSKDEQAVLKQMDNWIDALKRRDMIALNRIVAADFMLIAGDGKVLNREQDLEPVKSGEVKFDSMMTDEVKVFVYGDTAIITGIGTYQINYKGQSSTISERFYDIYQKRKGEWLVIASRPSSVPKKKSED